MSVCSLRLMRTSSAPGRGVGSWELLTKRGLEEGQCYLPQASQGTFHQAWHGVRHSSNSCMAFSAPLLPQSCVP